MTWLGVADYYGPQRSRGRLALRLDGSCRSAGARQAPQYPGVVDDGFLAVGFVTLLPLGLTA
jgi:hypothetical protein